MLNLPLADVEGNLSQINRLQEAGCEVVRIAVPHKADLDFFEEICKKSPLPVVADIHFSAELAIEAARRGAAKLRINPGNIGGLEATVPVLQAAKAAGIPIRIGVNAGSLDSALAERSDLTLPEKLVESATAYVEFCHGQGFYDVVVSAKAHDVPTTVATYRLLSQRMPEVPLLEQGIGDTMRISLTDDPTEEVRACWTLLSALGLRRRDPELVSCPTCGRCQVDLIPIAQEVEKRLRDVHRPIQVAVMGCVVNGPGEAADADIGVACGKGSGVVFAHGKTLRKVEEAAIVDVLMEEIGNL